METAAGPLTSSRHTVLSLIGAAADHLRTRGFDEARLHVELLLAHILNLTRLGLYLHFDRPLTAQELERFRTLFRRRLTHEPLQYILGETEFMGLRLEVNGSVLIPRPETELLVELAIACSAQRNHLPMDVLDACTGSGNIAIALARHLPAAAISALDVSEEALRVAAANAERLAPGRVELTAADLFTEFLPGRMFDLIVSNPPYVPAGELGGLEPEVRDFEPQMATTDGGDGLRFHRRLAELGAKRIRPGGKLIVEVGAGQAGTVAALFAAAGLNAVEITPDYSGIPRIVEARTS
jgi:release factor glutamine methyltransferase